MASSAKRPGNPLARARVPQRRPERAAGDLETRRRNAAPVLDIVERHDAAALSDWRRLERPGPRHDIVVIQPVSARHHAGGLLEHPGTLLRPPAEERVQPGMVVQPRVSPRRRAPRPAAGSGPSPRCSRTARGSGEPPARADATRRLLLRHGRAHGTDGPHRRRERRTATPEPAQTPRTRSLQHDRVLPPAGIELPEADRLHAVHRRELRARTVERMPVPAHRLMADDQPVGSRIVRGNRQRLESAADGLRRERRPHAVHAPRRPAS